MGMLMLMSDRQSFNRNVRLKIINPPSFPNFGSYSKQFDFGAIHVESKSVEYFKNIGFKVDKGDCIRYYGDDAFLDFPEELVEATKKLALLKLKIGKVVDVS